ncbi:hypothetical protein LCGC14_2007940 [marine sediment metagenome]|uniref:Uncharacterized protein n=1 Tax=marine sediment metagenome TaxID=412755 RepID=A0A0F9F146_9ZZZZ
MKWEEFDIKEEITIGAIFILGVLVLFSEMTDKAIILGTVIGVLGGVLKGTKKNGKKED